MDVLRRLVVQQFCLPFIERFLKSIVRESAETLRVIVPCVGRELTYGKEANNNEGPQESVTLVINDPLFMFWRLLLDAKMGLGESFMLGYWDASPNPTQFLNLLIRAKKNNRQSTKRKQSFQQVLSGYLVEGIRKAVALVNYLGHRLRDNTIGQSARNIEDHYDLGNEMFKEFLDPSMTYSCALFEDIEKRCSSFRELEDAQMRKIDRLLDMLKLTAEDHVLEIGCGWGAAAIRGVQRSGCRWTGITLSHEQLAWAQEKVHEAGLDSKIKLYYQDYRLCSQKHTKIISIEMIEAVGKDFLPQYFETINDCLEDGGTAVLQAIICPDAYYERYCKSSDFIKKYIFPGGHMPSTGAIQEALPASLILGDKTHIGLHYAKTLDMWFSAWIEKEEELRRVGLSVTFHRKWQYYFCICSALFSNHHIDTIQFSLQKRCLE